MPTTIYGLYDPRKPIELENCRYVGQTVGSLNGHLNNHLSRARNGGTTARDEWIRDVLADGVRPVIDVIDEAPDRNATTAECKWILNGFAWGWRLTNEGTGRVPIPWDSSPYLTTEFLERFWSNVTIGDQNQCWEWTAYTNKKHYGQTNIGLKRDKNKRRIYVHRLSWEIANGPIPDQLFVCHTCDNPPCVNPAHLFLDTGSGNMRDASAKGRVRNQFSDLESPTHCPRGHEYSVTSKGNKYCRICNRESVAESRRSDREAAGLPPAKKYGELTHCPQGHPYDEENTRVNENGTRSCRICVRDQSRVNARRCRERKRLAELQEPDE